MLWITFSCISSPALISPLTSVPPRYRSTGRRPGAPVRRAALAHGTRNSTQTSQDSRSHTTESEENQYVQNSWMLECHRSTGGSPAPLGPCKPQWLLTHFTTFTPRGYAFKTTDGSAAWQQQGNLQHALELSLVPVYAGKLPV